MFRTWIEDHANHAIHHAMHTAAVDHQFIPAYTPRDRAGNMVQLGGLGERPEGLLVAAQVAEHDTLAGPGNAVGWVQIGDLGERLEAFVTAEFAKQLPLVAPEASVA